MSIADKASADVRASDAERERVAELLRTHHTEGRLTLEEFTERVEEAYRARSSSDLDHVLRDLPRDQPHHPRPSSRRRWRRRRLPAWWLRVNGICTAIWALTTVGSGPHYFWPMWVMLGTGIPVVAAGRGGHHNHAHLAEAAVPEQLPPDPGAVSRVVSSVLFVDVVGSTEHAAAMGDAGWNAVLAGYEQQVQTVVAGHGGHQVFTKGDETVAAFPTPAAAVLCARSIRDRARALGLEIRAGLHAGEVDRQGNEMRGLAMHIGQRVCAAAQPGQLLVSGTVRDLLVGSTSLKFTDIGEHALKGVPGVWRLYEAAD